MKKMFLMVLLIVLFPVMLLADTLNWNQTGIENVVGWVVYYDEAKENGKSYNRHVVKADVLITDTAVQFPEFEHALNIPVSEEFNISLSAYNDYAESAKSSSISYTRAAYSPPPDNTPPETIVIPVPVGGTITINVH